MENNQTILVAPLDWGLGHATRCIPLIRQFVLDNHKVILAGQGSSLALLKQEFPDLQTLHFKNYGIRYPGSRFLFLRLLIQMPLFGCSILTEHMRLLYWVKKLAITTVISDNRYGMWHPKTLNVIITHQIFIQLPKHIKWLEPLLHNFTKRMIHQFNECWVPDFEDYSMSLSGGLSHGIKLPKNIKYIGPLSRFYRYKPPTNGNTPKAYPDVLVLISGPEPFRTNFQQQMEKRFANTRQNVLMVCGNLNPSAVNQLPATSHQSPAIIAHLSTPELYYYLKNTPQIITLSGYSTLMDLYALNRTAELIPTPGQTEQEYLANWWGKKEGFPKPTSLFPKNNPNQH